jgi:hypothetical protein
VDRHAHPASGAVRTARYPLMRAGNTPVTATGTPPLHHRRERPVPAQLNLLPLPGCIWHHHGNGNPHYRQGSSGTAEFWA